MKITEQHFSILKTAIDAILEKYNNNGQLVAEYESGNVIHGNSEQIQQRICFDLVHFAGLSAWINTLYEYLSGDDVYAELKAICPKVERKF